MRTAIATLVLGLLAAAPDEPAKTNDRPQAADKNDPKALQGRWRMVGTIQSGRTILSRGQEVRYFLDDQTRALVVSRRYAVSAEGSYSLVPREHAGAIDLHINWLTGQEQELAGIYDIDGDTLKIATSNNGVRPKSIDEKPNAGQTVMVFQREKN